MEIGRASECICLDILAGKKSQPDTHPFLIGWNAEALSPLGVPPLSGYSSYR